MNSPDVIREALEKLERVGAAIHNAGPFLPTGLYAELAGALGDASLALAAHDASPAGEGEGGAVTHDDVHWAAAALMQKIGHDGYADWTPAQHESWRKDRARVTRVHVALVAALNPSQPIQAAGVGLDELREQIAQLICDRIVSGLRFDATDLKTADDILALLPQPDQSPALDVKRPDFAALSASLNDEIAEAADVSDATPLERFVAEALVSDHSRERGLVDKVWVVNLPDARKAIAAVQAFSPSPVAAPAGWRDIATAPRDETEILLLVGKEAMQGRFNGPSDGAIYAGRPSVYNWFAGGCTHHDGQVTHWMPLPAPPGSASPPLPASGEGVEKDLGRLGDKSPPQTPGWPQGMTRGELSDIQFGRACNHQHWSYANDGRRCTCGELMVDAGD